MKTKFLFFVLLLFVFYGCNISESRDDCPPDRSLIFIRILDVLTGEDITEDTQDIENLTLYLFDKNKKFLTKYAIVPSEIHNHIPIDVTGMDLEGAYATVWANESDELVDMTEPESGDILTDLTVLLKRNIEQEGYYLCPGDLFFGYTKLSFTDYSTCCEQGRQATVDVMRKNARLHLTVRGLRNVVNTSDYYFRINAFEAGYDFEGTPIGRLTRDIRETGILNAINDFVSPEPYFMIHSPLLKSGAQSENIKVQLVSNMNGTAIISAEKDIEGNSIRLIQGRTTNVMMEILDSGDLQVHIVLTDWDEIYQWSNW